MSRECSTDLLKNKRRTNSLCKHPDVLVIEGIKEVVLEGRPGTIVI
jgi:hypothetical protein